jgi:hypothetical protein
VFLCRAFLYFRYKIICMEEQQQDGQVVQSPSSYRWIENGHIFLWLLKDTFWAMEFKIGGIFMIFPTLGVALYILWRSRHNRQEVFHNIAVALWISGNSVWMAGDFFKHEQRPLAASLFITGLAIMLFYYIFFFAKDRKAEAKLG